MYDFFVVGGHVTKSKWVICVWHIARIVETSVEILVRNNVKRDEYGVNHGLTLGISRYQAVNFVT